MMRECRRGNALVHARTVMLLIASLALIASTGCNRSDPQSIASSRTPSAAATHPIQTASTPSTTVTPPATPPPSDGALVLPGSFAADTSVTQLQQRFGKGNVSIAELPGAEGETARGIELFAKDPTRHAYVYFQDEQSLHGLSMVSVDGPGSRWTLDNGVRIGMTMSELVKLNGAPIVFTGFEWDYGGYVSDWSDGKLAPKNSDPIARGVRLQVRPDDNGSTDGAPSGDSEFRSDDPQYPGLGDRVEVGVISISFPGEDDL